LTLFNQGHLGGSLTPLTAATGLGGVVDGTLRQYGTFNENGLVEMPPSLNWLEGSTLSCAALTAWNGLYGVKSLQPGQVVLTQGTGGVSIFALQFAKAAGAIVIATTSSTKKAGILQKLGADHVLNYKDDPEWGIKAKELTPGKEGVDHIIEVGGPSTVKQSLAAVKIDGVISIIGFLGGAKNENEPSFMEILSRICIVRGVFVGNRVQFEEMVCTSGSCLVLRLMTLQDRAIEAAKIKPVVDEKVFTLEEAKE
jgi:NADPH:quinone reductase-like Zn-dependent oxidoreductase